MIGRCIRAKCVYLDWTADGGWVCQQSVDLSASARSGGRASRGVGRGVVDARGAAARVKPGEACGCAVVAGEQQGGGLLGAGASGRGARGLLRLAAWPPRGRRSASRGASGAATPVRADTYTPTARSGGMSASGTWRSSRPVSWSRTRGRSTARNAHCVTTSVSSIASAARTPPAALTSKSARSGRRGPGVRRGGQHA